jgi:hypothetical protein
MSSIKLDILIDEFPGEIEAIDRLAFLLDESDKKNYVCEYTPQRMYDLVRPSNQRVLFQILSSAAEKGILKKVVRVESVARGGIGDFDSVLDIPLTLLDTRLGYEIEVEPSQIFLIYMLNVIH